MKKKRILIIEDEPYMVELLKTRLEANNYEVIVAYDGMEGWRKARNEHPDLILLDIMLPGMDGFKICKLLKHDVRYRNVPIIMLTARANKEDMMMGKEAGADAYIAKPFDSKLLIQKIEELLGGKHE